jgi:putative nucleotidyltransferase with HDIG domain
MKKMSHPQKLAVDEAKIKQAILSGLPLTVTTFTLPHEIEIYIESLVAVFLKMARREELKDNLCYCVGELAVNAKKANTKRVYFSESGLDISNSDDYKKGMKSFKETTLDNISYFLQLQKEKGLYVKLVLQIREDTIHIEIRNNAAITRMELTRIQDRLARSRQYKSLEDALLQVLDDSEGAGLGLVILALMLKKMGLKEDCFGIHHSKNETIARLLIPLSQIHVENIDALSRAIADSVSSLPQFPENILEVQRLIATQTAGMTAIARQLSTDPALTADLLRLVNSAHYMLSKQVDNIFEAVKLVGIRGIKNLLYSYGTQKILGSDTAEKKLLWEHSYKTAFYAYNLVKKCKSNLNLLDDVYASGILHDMGKIVFSNIHPQLLEKIRFFCSFRDIPHSTFEDLSAGMNHAEIGALIAKKWNFPHNLVVAIQYHHNPSSAPQDCRDLVDSVYLANMFCEYENGKAHFDQFEEGPLVNYGITSKNQLNSIVEHFSQGFKKANENDNYTDV